MLWSRSSGKEDVKLWNIIILQVVNRSIHRALTQLTRICTGYSYSHVYTQHTHSHTKTITNVHWRMCWFNIWIACRHTLCALLYALSSKTLLNVHTQTVRYTANQFRLQQNLKFDCTQNILIIEIYSLTLKFELFSR